MKWRDFKLHVYYSVMVTVLLSAFMTYISVTHHQPPTQVVDMRVRLCREAILQNSLKEHGHIIRSNDDGNQVKDLQTREKPAIPSDNHRIKTPEKQIKNLQLGNVGSVHEREQHSENKVKKAEGIISEENAFNEVEGITSGENIVKVAEGVFSDETKAQSTENIISDENIAQEIEGTILQKDGDKKAEGIRSKRIIVQEAQGIISDQQPDKPAPYLPWSSTSKELVGKATAIALNHGLVLFSVINDDYWDLASSWLCNTAPLGNVHPKVLMLCTDVVTGERLQRRWPEISMVSFNGSATFSGPRNFSQAGYVRLMVARTRFILPLLQARVPLLLFEVDFAWLSDPLPHVLSQPGNPDIVAMRDGPWQPEAGTGAQQGVGAGAGAEQGKEPGAGAEPGEEPGAGAEPGAAARAGAGAVPGEGTGTGAGMGLKEKVCGCFLLLRPTRATRKVWARKLELVEELLAKIADQRSDALVKEGLGNDQKSITMLINNSYAGVKFAFLSSDLFPCGMWYNRSDLNRSRSLRPVAIHNNWEVGKASKVERAKKFGHWFLAEGSTADDVICNVTAVHNVLNAEKLMT